MSKLAKLTFIITNGSAEVLPQLQDVALRSWLARAAGRGVFRSVHRDDPDSQDHLDSEMHLLAALGLLPQAKTLASAPVCLAADSISGFWVRAEPLHFAAGMTRIDALTLKGPAMLSGADRAEIAVAIGDHIGSLGLRWDSQRWLIGFERALDLQTRQPNLAAELESAMPAGADAKEVRRLMTELQMVLHEHPVNVRRARSGLPAANAVWVWGGGSVIANARDYTSSAKIVATDAFSLGLAHLLGILAIVPDNAEQVLEQTSGVDAAIVVDLNDNNDVLQSWLRPLQMALVKRRFDTLVIAIDQWTIELTRTSFWRVWRKDVPLEQWGAA